MIQTIYRIHTEFGKHETQTLEEAQQFSSEHGNLPIETIDIFIPDEIPQKPLMSGHELTAFIRNMVGKFTLPQKVALLTPLVVTFNVIENDTTFTQQDFNDAISLIENQAITSKLFTLEQIETMKATILTWSQDFSFYIA